MSAHILHFPAGEHQIVRLVHRTPMPPVTDMPPLWTMVALLEQHQRCYPETWDADTYLPSRLARHIVANARRIALQGDDAPLRSVLRAMEFCWRLMRRQRVSPAPFYIEPPIGAP